MYTLFIGFRKYLILIVLSFGFGIYFYQSSSSFVTSIAIIYIVSSFLILSIFLIINLILSKYKSLSKGLLILIILIFTFLLGILRIGYVDLYKYNDLKEYANDSVWVTGVVQSPPVLSSSGRYYGFNLKLTQLNSNKIKNSSIKLYLNEANIKNIKLYDTITCFTSLTTPQEPKFTGDMDYSVYLKQKNIPYIGFTQNAEIVDTTIKLSCLDYLKRLGEYINSNMSNLVDTYFSYNIDSSALVKGIMTGDKSDFSDDLYTDFSNAGFSHIVAVSGMHVSTLFSAICYILSRFRIRKGLIYVSTIPILIIFMSVSAFTPSVCRAVIMLIIFILSFTLQKEPDQMTAIFTAAGIMMVLNPYNLFNAGFILSFGAVIGIQLYYRLFKNLLNFISKVPIIGNILIDSFSLTISSFLGTVFFSAYFFNNIAYLMLITNIWIIPIVTAIFYGGYLTWIVGLLCPFIAQNYIKYLLVLPVEIVNRTAEISSKIDFLHISVKSPTNMDFIFYILILALIYIGLKVILTESGKKGA